MNETYELIRQAQSGDAGALEKITVDNSGLVWAIVRRYLGQGTEADDLYQLGCIGLIKAVKGFDFTYCTRFSTYAVPKISGEIRRFLRDDGSVKVGRTLREQGQMIWSARERLRQSLQREPTISELSRETELTVEELAHIELANIAPESLQQEKEEGLTLERLLGTEAPEEGIVEKIALRDQIEGLPIREREVIFLRYYRNMTQQQVARILHISQVQVSRLERRSIGLLRQALV